MPCPPQWEGFSYKFCRCVYFGRLSLWGGGDENTRASKDLKEANGLGSIILLGDQRLSDNIYIYIYMFQYLSIPMIPKIIKL